MENLAASRSGGAMRNRQRRQKPNRLSDAQIQSLLQRRSCRATISELTVRIAIHRTTVMAHIKRSS